MQKIILASQSPRRKQLLEWAEIPFEIIVKTTDETYPGELSVEKVPIHIARQKAIAVKENLLAKGNGVLTDKIILAADTIVVLESRIIGKPQDREDAISILTALSGRTHKVITGVVILHAEGERAFSDIPS